ncbi:MAG: cobalamin B12-binding domain-containing protein [Deltaproteobacteria bacterium]|nr:cobalamin B12-binding domain-containing protein [Deltaproteobacteria bacterium]MBW2075350.1 cobalamin B12-binding domain-containing protein [Deltaproteobacteria bacterium]
MNTRRRIKVLLAKTSLDGHNRGVKIISRWLMEAGMEVVFLGQYLLEEEVIIAAIEEAVDVIGFSFLGGEHLNSIKITRDLLEKEGLLGKVTFIVGGVIPMEDVDKLYELGVDRVFLPGTPLDEIVRFIETHVSEKRAA